MISEKLQSYVDTLDSMDDMMDRYTWLMELGRSPLSFRRDSS